MTISVRCPKCGHGYQLRDELAGKQAKCRCGATLSIPVATSLTSLLDEEHIGPSPDDVIPPAPAAALASARSKSSPKFGKGFSHGKKHGKDNTVAIVAGVVGGVAVLFVVILVLFMLSGGEDKPLAVAPPPPAPSAPPQPTALPGQGSPQEVFETYKQAWLSGNWARVYELLAPQAREQMTAILAVMGASLGPVCPELAAVAKQHGVEPAALAGLMAGGGDPFAQQSAQPSPDALAAQVQGMGNLIKDKPAFFAAAMPEFIKFVQSDKFAGIAQLGGQMSGVSLTSGLDLLPIMSAATTLSDVAETGESASGVAKTPPPAAPPGATPPAAPAAEKVTPMKFNQISGSWYVGAAL